MYEGPSFQLCLGVQGVLIMATVVFDQNRDENTKTAIAVSDSLGDISLIAVPGPYKGYLSGGIPLYYARYSTGLPADDLTLFLYCENMIVATTTTDANGGWRFDDLDTSKRYDIVVKHATYEGTLSRNRLPEPYPLEISAVIDRSQKYLYNPDIYEITAVARNYRGTLSATVPVGTASVSSIDQKTGEIVVAVNWFALTTTTLRVADSFGYVDIDITPPSRTDINWSKVKALLRFNNTSTPTTFIDEANGSASWTATGTVVVSSVDKKFGLGSALFTGGSSFLTGPAPDLEKSFSMEAFFKIPSLPTGTSDTTSIFSIAGLFGHNGGSVSSWNNVVCNLVVLWSGKPAVYTKNFFGSGSIIIKDGGTVVPDTWHHMALIYDDETFIATLLFDGDPVASLKVDLPSEYPPLQFSSYDGTTTGVLIGAGARSTVSGSGSTLFTPNFIVPDGTYIDNFRLCSNIRYQSAGFSPLSNDFLGSP